MVNINIRVVVVCVGVCVLSVPMVYAGTYSGGSGGSATPHLISSAADWLELIATDGDWDKHFRVTADIDFGGASLTPVGVEATSFTGVLDGRGYVFRHATINQPAVNYVGLFGHLGSGGQIRNLGVEDITVSGNNRVGGLVGSQDENSLINNCYTTGTVSGTERVGGLVGRQAANSSVNNCHTTGTVSGNDYIGGLTGVLLGTLMNSYATGDVSATVNSIGGLVGYMSSGGKVITCHAEGDVSGERGVAGLVGTLENNTEIINSYATGAVNGIERVGGLVGRHNGGTISNSYATGTVEGTGSEDIGGLVGRQVNAEAMIINCYATGNVTTSSSRVGGLVGRQENGKVVNSYATGAVTGVGGVAGLVGFQDAGGEIIDSYATGEVEGEVHNIGGLVGRMDGSIARSYATGSVAVTGTGDKNRVGGLVGSVYGSSSITNSYATGAVSGTTDRLGGLIGELSNGTVENCYAIGLVAGSGADVGGVIGQQIAGTVSGSYWNTETTNQGASAGGAGAMARSTAEMTHPYAGNTFQGWDFVDVWAADTTYNYNNGYPYLLVYIGSGGFGTEAAPYIISTVADWQELINRPLSWNRYFVVANDIDFGGISITRVGNDTTPFSGVLDGDGHVLRNAEINQPGVSYVGLFGYLNPAGEIRDLGVENINVEGREYVGGLVGQSEGTITDCYTTGTVDMDSYVPPADLFYGGLVGYQSGGKISDCYATGDVSGSRGVGGLVGMQAAGTITSSSASGTVVSTGNSVGGLVGRADDTIINSYAIGNVQTTGRFVGGLVGALFDGTITNSYALGAIESAGDEDVGGLVGLQTLANSKIIDSHATGAVSYSGAGNRIGGLVGRQSGGKVVSSYATGAVSGTGAVGGLVGYQDVDGTITDSYATGAIEGIEHNIGGLVGRTNSIIARSYATGTAHITDPGGERVGGLVGAMFAGSAVTDCYATGAVSGTNTRIGGLSGYAINGVIENCYAIGFVDATGAEAGGLLGVLDTGASVIGCYWNTETTNQGSSAGGVGAMGRTTAEMTHPYAINTYEDWNFAMIWAYDGTSAHNAGYPYLRDMGYEIASVAGYVVADSLGDPQVDTWYLMFCWHDSQTASRHIGISVFDTLGNPNTDLNTNLSGIPADGQNIRFMMAREDNSDTPYLNGIFDQVFVWDRIVGAGQRLDLYNTGLGLDCSFNTPDFSPTPTPTTTPTNTPSPTSAGGPSGVEGTSWLSYW